MGTGPLGSSAVVAAGLVLSGLGNFVLIGQAARILDASDFTAFTSWWLLANLVGLSLSPVESWLPAAIGAATRAGEDDGLTERRILLGAVRGIRRWFLVVAASAVALAPLWIDAVIDGDLVALATGLSFSAALVAAALQRALAVRRGDFIVVGGQLALQGVLVLVGVLAATGLGVDSFRATTLVPVMAVIGSMLVLAPRTRLHPDPERAQVPVDLGGLRALVVAAVGPLAVANIPVPWLRAQGTTPAALLAFFAGAVVLSRLPIQLVGAVQGPLVHAFLQPDQERGTHARSLLIRSTAVLVALAGLFTAAFALVGQQLVGLYLGGGAEPLPSGYLATLAAGTGGMLATVPAMALLVVRGQNRDVRNSWTIGLLAFGGTLLLPVSTPLLRATSAPVVAAVLVLALLLRRAVAATSVGQAKRN